MCRIFQVLAKRPHPLVTQEEQMHKVVKVALHFSLLSCCCYRHYEQKQLEKEMVYFILHISLSPKEATNELGDKN